ncbi:MAG: serine/threonine protein kinase [Polyangiaceae bacterium]|nr:serine/threonine protein kinase [Polyangiaceae bacterium]
MQRFIRCGHCGLPHDADVVVCPSSGLRIEPQKAMVRRRRSAPELTSGTQGLLTGQVIDRKYRLCELIGEGGMSAIYDAEHLGLSRHVAIKVLHPSLSADPRAMARLQHEAQVVSAIGHPSICAIYDLGTTEDGSPFLVMERLYGRTLADRLAKEGPMAFRELVAVLRQVLAALAAAHAKGIVHRDLKPENIFLERPKTGGRSSTKLLDFGISKSAFAGADSSDAPRPSQPGMVLGTPYYMAPEQARGDSGLDQRVDLWAIGVILYEALSGRRPFVAPNYNALLVKILTSDPRPLDRLVDGMPAALSALVARALRKLPEDRFQSAADFQSALSSVARTMAEDATDGGAPTLVMQRAGVREPGGDVGRAASWRGSIDDPETNIDDQTGEGLHVVSDTDRAPASLGPEPEPSDGGDTEIMAREPAFDAAGPGADHDTVRPAPRWPTARTAQRLDRAVGSGRTLGLPPVPALPRAAPAAVPRPAPGPVGVPRPAPRPALEGGSTSRPPGGAPPGGGTGPR